MLINDTQINIIRQALLAHLFIIYINASSNNIYNEVLNNK